MSRFAYGEAHEADKTVETAISGIGAEIESLCVPHLKGVVLGGGYGRGEGGVFTSPDGKETLSNDLDFYVVADECSGKKDLASIAAALAPVSSKWTARLGIDVDFCEPKTPWRMKHDMHRIMVQELLAGYVDVAGEKGDKMFADIPRIDPCDVPWQEAVRFLVNRGAGLLLALVSKNAEFTARNINKCVLGAGDARLVASRRYSWRLSAREQALGESLYTRAAQWKTRPGKDPVCGWEEARRGWLASKEEVMASPRADMSRRTVHFMRWMARCRRPGAFRTAGMDPLLRVLYSLSRRIEAREPMPLALVREWRIFG